MLKRMIGLIIVFVLLAVPTSAALADKPIGDGQTGKPADVGHKGKPPELKPKGNQFGLSGKVNEVNTLSQKGFDEFGYNWTARIFNGTGFSWCMGKLGPLGYTEEMCLDYMGKYAKDKLVMKWNAEWDHGNADGWVDSYYNAWENNEWNGKVPGGSGEVWHYKIVWVGNCDIDPTLVPEGAYCIWGQFVVISDHGISEDLHSFLAKSKPNGYGVFKTKTED